MSLKDGLTVYAKVLREKGHGEEAIKERLRSMNEGVSVVSPLAEDEMEAIMTGGNTPPPTSMVNSGHFSHIGLEGRTWEPPVPLDSCEAPEFPVSALPSWLVEWVAAQAEATQTPPDLAAMTALGVISAACAKKYMLQVRPGWKEPLNLMVATALPSGNRKSPIFAAAAEPIYAYEREHHAEWAEIYQRQLSAYSVAEKALRHAEDLAAKAKGPDADMTKEESLVLAKQLAGMRKPVFPRLIADDATPEKISSLMAEQGGRLAICSAEGGLFTILAGRYNDTPLIDCILKGHAGDPLRVDRVGRPSECLDAPALTIFLTVQPGVIHDLAETRIFLERGLVARFLFSIPLSRVGFRKVDPPPVSEAIHATYTRHIKALLEIPETRGDNGEITSAILQLSPVGQAMVTDFMAAIEPRLGQEGDLAPLADWAAKLPGALTRIAGILHLAEHVSGESGHSLVDDEILHHALELGPYLIAHARSAYQLLGGGHVGEAHRVLAWIYKQQRTAFTKRECWRALRGHLKTAKDLDRPLMLLQEHGFIRPAQGEPAPRTGRPSEAFEVNPLGQNGQYGQNVEGRP